MQPPVFFAKTGFFGIPPQGTLNMSSSDAGDPALPLFNQIESHGNFVLICFVYIVNKFYPNLGLRLPDYIVKLLLLTGYDNLHAISKLVNYELISELESYGTDFLEASDLGLTEEEGKHYFSQMSKKFRILPGHKHLITAAGYLAKKVLHINQVATLEDMDSDNERTYDNEQGHNSPNEAYMMNNIQPSAQHIIQRHIPPPPEPAANEFPHEGMKAETAEAYPTSMCTIEIEREALAGIIRTWIARKIRSGNLTAFIYESDYRILVHRPKSANPIYHMDVFLFVCHRCNTTIKVFKRPNGNSWNCANVYRHITTVHFIQKPYSIVNTPIQLVASNAATHDDKQVPLDLNISATRQDSPVEHEH